MCVTELLDRVAGTGIPHSTEGLDRLVRSHGQTLHDIYHLRCSPIVERIPDIVLWPGMSLT